MSTESTQSYKTIQEENAALKRAVEELSVLNDLAQAVAISSDLNEILNAIVRRSLVALNAEQGVITLVDESGEDPLKTLVRVVARSSEKKKFHFNEGLLGWMLLNKKPLLLDDPNHHPKFNLIPWDEPIHSLLCVPMMVKGRLTGVITVYNSKGKTFSENDQRLLTIIAAQMAQIVENVRLEEEKREMQVRIARDLHDDVGSSLSSIALYAESLKRELGSGSRQATETIDKMSSLSLDAVDTMGDIVWSITPDQETFDALLIRMKNHAIELFNTKEIRYKLDFMKNAGLSAVPPEVLRNMYLIFKEALHNVVKHSQAQSVSIEIEIRGGVLSMKISDDGIGFSTEHLTRANGLRNMERRAKDIHAVYSLESNPGKGTRVTFRKKMT